MKTAVVKFSTIIKYGRWDASFYLGDERTAAELKRATELHATAVKRLEEAQKAVLEESNRRTNMIHSGEVVPLPSTNV